MPVPTLIPCPHFTLLEDSNWSYAPRTYANARADATLAYAADFTTRGEVLTAKAAGAKILQVAVGTPAGMAAERLLAHLRVLDAKSLNIAGNGIYSLSERFPHIPPDELQMKLDCYVLRVLTLVHATHPLQTVRSGGQTGVDQSGIRAGLALGIPTIALLPKGFRMRTAEGKDITTTFEVAWNRFVVPTPAAPQHAAA